MCGTVAVWIRDQIYRFICIREKYTLSRNTLYSIVQKNQTGFSILYLQMVVEHQTTLSGLVLIPVWIRFWFWSSRWFGHDNLIYTEDSTGSITREFKTPVFREESIQYTSF